MLRVGSWLLLGDPTTRLVVIELELLYYWTDQLLNSRLKGKILLYFSTHSRTGKYIVWPLDRYLRLKVSPLSWDLGVLESSRVGNQPPPLVGIGGP